MSEKEQTDSTNKICEKSQDGKHAWEVKLHSPGNHGEKKMVEIFVCKYCGLKKPIKQKSE